MTDSDPYDGKKIPFFLRQQVLNLLSEEARPYGLLWFQHFDERADKETNLFLTLVLSAAAASGEEARMLRLGLAEWLKCEVGKLEKASVELAESVRLLREGGPAVIAALEELRASREEMRIERISWERQLAIERERERQIAEKNAQLLRADALDAFKENRKKNERAEDQFRKAKVALWAVIALAGAVNLVWLLERLGLYRN